MHDQVKKYGHDDVDLLLPWYVNGTLGTVEYECVQSHVADCARCQESVSLLEKVQAGVQHGSATPIVQSRFDDLLEDIETDSGRQGHRSWLPALALVASIAALVIAATMALSNKGPGANGATRFETATSLEQSAPLDYVLDVQFEDGVALRERERVLQEIDAVEIVTGRDEDTFRIVIRLPVTSLEDLERHTLKIAARSEIKSVSVVALQLPMR